MRIGIDAHFVGVRHGGNEHYFEHVIRELARLGGAEYFAFNQALAGLDRLAAHSVTVVPLRTRSVYLQRALEIPLLARRLGLDVLHVPFNFLPVGRARKLVTIHDLAFLHLPDAFGAVERARMTMLTGLSARHAHHIFTDSEFSKRDIVRAYRVPDDRVTVTPLAADTARFTEWDEPRRAAWRAARGLDHEYLLFVGTLQPRKNVGTLLRAFAALRESGARDVHLALVGRRGWLYDEVFRFIDERGLAGHVHHHEGVSAEDLVGFYNCAAAFVFPSLFEGFGLPILEAMACGCPVVSSNTSSMPEVYGDAALSFAPTDEPALAARLREVLGDASLRSELVRRGRANVSRFSWAATAAAIRRVYLAA